MPGIYSFIVAFGNCVVVAAVLGQGTLTPTGTPGPTMKTLDQVEARTPVQSLPGDSSNQYVISAPGSYYLTGNLTGVSGKNGIFVSASHVTIDLNGFSLVGVSGALAAVYAPTFVVTGLAVTNGNITGWPGLGISAANCVTNSVLKVVFSACAGGAAHVGSNALIRDCVVENCGSPTSAALSALSNSIISHCTVHGYLAGDGDGIQVDYGSLVESCVCSEHGGSGIVLNGASIRVRDCVCFANQTDGIRGNNYCHITECTCGLNGNTANAATAAGIHLTSANGQGSSIDHCFSTNNRGRGIAVDMASGNNVVSRCTATGNTTANYAIATGNRPALIVTYSTSTGYTSGDPLVNVQ